ncbi:glycosyltransferase [Aeromonas caviae]|uniref:glycosyltransferase n=1 Tax=Aeromonas caviae TaxID=648 RepID=UPI00286849BA|nr:glycosyltransferase [Aeromonas caviae]WMX35613.1 glycosyltransferase [Aeromonas caviae]
MSNQKNNMRGAFSALLSVYYKESPCFLDLAMDSIWHQQSLKPSQIVLVKDGFLPADLEIVIDKWFVILGDVLTIVTLKKNVGLASALNYGLKYCKFELVARMDTDDIALPHRFKLQFDLMSKDKNIAVSSGVIEEWDESFTNIISRRILPTTFEEIVVFAKKRSPISHPACMFRKSVVIDVGGYPNIYPEDHLLWVKIIIKGYKLSNLPDVLLRMRAGNSIAARRGLSFLKGELHSYRLMYNSGFLSYIEYLQISILRSLLRLSPNVIKFLLYKLLR